MAHLPNARTDPAGTEPTVLEKEQEAEESRWQRIKWTCSGWWAGSLAKAQYSEMVGDLAPLVTRSQELVASELRQKQAGIAKG